MPSTRPDIQQADNATLIDLDKGLAADIAFIAEHRSGFDMLNPNSEMARMADLRRNIASELRSRFVTA